MKKSVLFAGAFVAALALGGLQAQTVSAADGTPATDTTATDPKTSTADFTIAPATDADQHAKSGLYFTTLPSFSFGSAKLDDIISKGDTRTDNSSKDDTLSVNDYSSTSLGWTVTATMGDFVSVSPEGNPDPKADTISGVTLAYKQDKATGDNTENVDAESAISLTSGAATDGNGTTVVTAPAGSGQGKTSTKASEATLTIPKHAAAMARKYTSTITWTLAPNAAPKATESGTTSTTTD